MLAMRGVKNIGVFLVLVSGLASVSMAQSTVASANILGYTKKQITPGQYTLLGVNFGDENQTLIDVLGTNQLTSSSDFATADRVMLFDPIETVYRRYALKSPQNEFYPCNTVLEWYTSSATNPVIPIGTGLWIIPASGATETNTLLLSGNVALAPTSLVSVIEGYQLISYPFSADMALGDISISNLTQSADFATADRIILWDGDTYSRFGLKNDGKWYPCNTVPEWYTSPAETNRVIHLGEGFWLVSQGVTTYVVPSPYFSNLN